MQRRQTARFIRGLAGGSDNDRRRGRARGVERAAQRGRRRCAVEYLRAGEGQPLQAASPRPSIGSQLTSRTCPLRCVGCGGESSLPIFQPATMQDRHLAECWALRSRRPLWSRKGWRRCGSISRRATGPGGGAADRGWWCCWWFGDQVLEGEAGVPPPPLFGSNLWNQQVTGLFSRKIQIPEVLHAKCSIQMAYG